MSNQYTKKITLEVRDVDSVKSLKFSPGDYILVVNAQGYDPSNLMQVLETLQARGVNLWVLLEYIPNSYRLMEIPEEIKQRKGGKDT